MKLKFLLHDEVQRERRASLRKVVACCYFAVLLAVVQIVWAADTDTLPGTYFAAIQGLSVRLAWLGAIGCFAYGTIALVQLIGMGKWDK